jgi:hypothetical protein
MPTYLPIDVIVPDITTFNLTEAKFDGNGVFDKLMKSVNAQILEQFQSERITADNYGTVYLGSLQSVLAQSVQFLLTKDKAAYDAALSLTQVKKGIQETELVKSQILLTDAQTDKTKQDIELSKEQQTLISFQRDKTAQEILVLAGQVIKINKENDILDKDLLKLSEEILLLQQAQVQGEENILKTKEEVLGLKQQVLLSTAQVAKTEGEVQLITQQVLNSKQDLIKSIAEVVKLNKDIDLISQQILNAKEQVLKSKAEVAILEQRVITEVAQTQDGAAGIIGAQTSLYKAQTKGFSDDSIRKGVKAANDVFAIAKSNDPDAVSDPTNMLSTLEYFLGVMQSTQEST